MMVILSVLLFSAASIVALASIAGTVSSSAPRIAQVLRTAAGRPEELPPHRATARRRPIMEATSAGQWRAAA